MKRRKKRDPDPEPKDEGLDDGKLPPAPAWESARWADLQLRKLAREARQRKDRGTA